MTVVFGALTTQFTSFGTAVLNASSTPDGPAQLEAATSALNRQIATNILYLVYIGIGTAVCTFIYMATFVYSGEKATRRIRERYLAATLRQNVAFMDVVGAGAVTTRIETDSALIQAGISEKVPLALQFISQFVAGFVVAFVVNWRLALVLSSICEWADAELGMISALTCARDCSTRHDPHRCHLRVIHGKGQEGKSGRHGRRLYPGGRGHLQCPDGHRLRHAATSGGTVRCQQPQGVR